MGKMKALAEKKVKEEKRALTEELEMIIMIEKLKELRAIRRSKLSKQGHFFPEEDDDFLARVKASAEEEERAAAAAAAAAEPQRMSGNVADGDLDGPSKGISFSSIQQAVGASLKAQSDAVAADARDDGRKKGDDDKDPQAMTAKQKVSSPIGAADVMTENRAGGNAEPDKKGLERKDDGERRGEEAEEEQRSKANAKEGQGGGGEKDKEGKTPSSPPQQKQQQQHEDGSVGGLPTWMFHYYYGATVDMGALIEVRRAWDAFIMSGGSRIPSHWVQPAPPSDPVWASYLVTNKKKREHRKSKKDRRKKVPQAAAAAAGGGGGGGDKSCPDSIRRTDRGTKRERDGSSSRPGKRVAA
ncbi:hypothetical protein CBR_g45167 [Chara braunii]|uniref:Uncharacterized protein n=1 Tax=Chara braunii TaxID=69332 RepID=A0A388K342_CHABU|nr:hypothetical protein CBR_g45167 [Chara braunii]|eukprot:GBG64471.1 hypothetical protein CBR_g45167 [Chara braunii]